MTDTTASRTRTVTVIKASPETLYRAFTDPTALAVWRVPGDDDGQDPLVRPVGWRGL